VRSFGLGVILQSLVVEKHHSLLQSCSSFGPAPGRLGAASRARILAWDAQLLHRGAERTATGVFRPRQSGDPLSIDRAGTSEPASGLAQTRPTHQGVPTIS